MKHNSLIQKTGFLFLIVGMASCAPDKYELGTALSKSDLHYEITQNPDDPNMIILNSLTAGYTPLWQTPMGRSTAVTDTVLLPFSGIYEFIYGVQSNGGYVQADTFTLDVTTTNLSYVNDPFWTALSGGVGKSKTWYLDLDADAVCRYFTGPMYYYGTDNGWLGECYGEDCWNWLPDYAGNSWLMEAANYGSMTFDLIDGANVTVDNLVLPSNNGSGTYMLDNADYSLTLTDVGILHNPEFHGIVIDWGKIRIFNLTEDIMQLGVLRDPVLSNDGECYLVFNFISKDYYDNWVPEEAEDPEPVLPEGWKDDVSMLVSNSIKWVLSPETPFNWANPDGSLMNTDWVSADTYADWTGMNTDVPASYADFSLTMNSSDNTVLMTLPDGAESSGTYTLDEKGVYTFSGITPEFTICGGWVNLSTTADNQWRILSIEKEGGRVSGMWVGALSADKPEYMCYKLVPQSGGVNESNENEGTAKHKISFRRPGRKWKSSFGALQRIWYYGINR